MSINYKSLIVCYLSLKQAKLPTLPFALQIYEKYLTNTLTHKKSKGPSL